MFQQQRHWAGQQVLAADGALPPPWQGDACPGLPFCCQVTGDPGSRRAKGGFLLSQHAG